MADTKQATAETVCEHCGQSRSAHRWLMAWCSGEPGDGRRFTPRTQPSQTALRIPDDLKLDWETLNAPYLKPVTLEWAIERDMSMQQFAKKLIERIARLGGQVDDAVHLLACGPRVALWQARSALYALR